MAEEGHKKAGQVLKLTADSSNFLATIQIGVTLAGFLTSATAAQSLAEPLANWFIGLVPVSYTHLFLGCPGGFGSKRLRVCLGGDRDGPGRVYGH